MKRGVLSIFLLYAFATVITAFNLGVILWGAMR
jgi:hypothetical protein